MTPFQSKAEWVDEEFGKGTKAYEVANFLLFRRTKKLKDVKVWMERFEHLDREEQDIFRYLLIDGAVNDPDEAFRQIREIQFVEDIRQFLLDHFQIPEDMQGWIDTEHLLYRAQTDGVSLFTLNSKWYLQEA